MDKSWMHADRRSKAYEFGLEAFLNFAVENLLTTTHIRCPCVKCVNLKLFGVGIIRDHVYFNGIDQSYKNWTFHGEPWEATTNASRNVEEDDGHGRYSFVSEEIDMDDNDFGDFGDFGSDPYEFANVIGDGDQPVYPGCTKYTKLSALVKLYNLKAKHGMSDVCFTELLILQGDLLPEGNTIPTSMYEAKKTLCALGLSYEKMHACPNDCILYRKEYEDSTNCPTCGISRWKEGKDSILKEGVPAKVVWYFPPIPRFKRMFQSHETAKSLTWHAARKSIDGQMSHPADSPSWKLLDDKWPEFGNEPRNLRLALSSDGFNPHSSLSSRYSCWPVILVTYNLPPWLCMKRKFMMLTLLISGPKQPENDIDVYLEPLIDDLKSLWVGIRGVYDAHNGEYFTLRAALMWTINDFPAYGNLSGCVVKGYKTCPICGDDTPSHRLKNGHKICYIGHRKWLPINHPYRRQRAAFNGKPEYGIPPEPLTGEEVLHMVENGDRVCWKKKSIFFDLEYWKYLPVRHALDVMHIEKNVCDSIIGTLLEIPEKNKDGIAARLDLLNMGVKTDLQPKYGERRTRLPPGPWNLSRAEKREVCNSFYGMKVPEGYSSNIKNLVSLQDSRLLGLKSHDCHTLMQQLLPVAIRSVLEKPARYMKVLKGYVQNRTRPEGCITERYIAEEAVEFCTQHLSDVSTVGVPSSQKMGVSKPLSGCTVSVVDQDLLNQAHLYVLENTEEVLPYIEQHMIHIKTAYPKFRKRTKWLQDKHNSTFIQWLRFKVQSELEEDNHGVSENLRWLAAGPNMAVPLYRSYLIKGIKFNIKAQDDVRTTQNSGVYLLAHTMQVASAKDKNSILSNMGFYGVIQEIWDLDYQKFTIPVFREYNDVIGDEVLGDVIIECEPFTRGMPNVDTFDELVGELGGQNIRDEPSDDGEIVDCCDDVIDGDTITPMPCHCLNQFVPVIQVRLVAKDYTQTYGVDYQETFALVEKNNIVRILLSLVANMEWPLLQFDVKNAFFHGDLKKEVYMDLPMGELKYFIGIEDANLNMVGVYPDQVSTNKERYERIVVRYLKVAPGKGLVFSKHGHVDVKWYTNAYWTGSIKDHHSTSRYFTFVSGNLVTWRSKKQKVEARLSAEAKIHGMSHRVYELLWSRNFVGRFWVQIRNAHEFPL
ncbi:hypothetical protein L3X38_024790 [Prunus dulcis]|uniref:Transposable element protein n=1 Tax=Prunus dulcis TaxID=3755 RepID=A0AAD4Z5S2_PRUDU|nr:hypothetical protein L3X38_024790 [Prunus dulcis]